MISRIELLDRIISLIDPAEWSELEGDDHMLPVNEFNRSVLLRLYEFEPADGKVNIEDVELLRTMLASYLEEQLPEKPEAHRFIIASCLGLTFVLREPMHPVEPTGIRSFVRDGVATYYCPIKNDSVTCGMCVCLPMSDWDALTERSIETYAQEHGDAAARIARAAFDAGLLETGMIDVDKLTFHESVRAICESNSCGTYNKTWACPPAVGDLNACREQCLAFTYMQVASCAYMLDDEFDFEGMARCVKDFEHKFELFGSAVRDIVPECLILSNEGCSRCVNCTWPDAPCRFPDKMHPAIEGYGFIVSELATLSNVRYSNGPRTVTFFGAVLY